MAKKPTQRITLDLSERSWDRLSRLQEVMEAGTKVGVIQSALQLLEFVVDRTQQGHTFLDRDAIGNVETLAILGLTPARATPLNSEEEDARSFG